MNDYTKDLREKIFKHIFRYPFHQYIIIANYDISRWGSSIDLYGYETKKQANEVAFEMINKTFQYDVHNIIDTNKDIIFQLEHYYRTKI